MYNNFVMDSSYKLSYYNTFVIYHSINNIVITFMLYIPDYR